MFKSTNPLFSEILLPLFDASNFHNCDVFIFMLLLSGGYVRVKQLSMGTYKILFPETEVCLFSVLLIHS